MGSLSIFTEDRRATDIPAYDHEDLARIFKEIKIRIEDILRSVRDYEFEQRYFLGVGLGMQASLEPTWFHSNWEWCIGVKKGDLSVPECRNLLSAGVLDWKFGSSRQVENIFLRRSEGVQLRPLERADSCIARATRLDLFRSSAKRLAGMAGCGCHANTRHAAQRFADCQQGSSCKVKGRSSLPR